MFIEGRAVAGAVLVLVLTGSTAVLADASAPRPLENPAPPADTAIPQRPAVAGEAAAAPVRPAAAFTKSVAPGELAVQQQSTSPPIVLDVRTPAEFAAGHVPGAINVQHDQVESRLAELERYREREIVLYCRSGKRAAGAADVLRRHGFDRLVHLEGDMPAWEASGQAVVKP